jgi:oligopeptidase B
MPLRLRRAPLALLVPLTLAAAMTHADPPMPPKADRVPHVTVLHGDTLVDDFRWLRDRQHPRVTAYLEAENAYTEALTAPTRGLEQGLYDEMLARIKQTDLSVPYRKGGHLYYTRTVEGRQYPIHCRRAGSMEAPEQILLDVNALAEGHRFMAVGAYEVSPDGSRLAYSTDSTGYRQYALRVRDLGTGRDLADHAERVTSVAWASDGRTLFYTQEHPVSKRSYRLYRHELGTERHELLYEEADERFDLDVRRSRSDAWLIQTRGSHTTSEVAVLPADRPLADWRLIAPRVPDREYYLDHRGDRFWIRANDRGRNFRLVTAPVATPGPDHWAEVIPHRDDVMLASVHCFRDHVVLGLREEGLPALVVMDPESRAIRRTRFDEVAYTVAPAANPEFASATFRYSYQSFLTPPSVYDLDLATLRPTLLKRTEVLGGWDPARYAMERRWAVAKDGTRVPITLLRRGDRAPDRPAPCLLSGYGSYGFPQNVTFSTNRFSLVDRGMVVAIAHVRGGGEFGETWHEAGRMAHKMNTFTDFIACAEALIAQNVTRADRLVISGGSAGGLLVGAVANLRPDLFRGVLALVPFVDVINTMLDESLPLTVSEFEEWGNPKVPEQYRWIRAYSPYDNLRAAPYPAMLVRTSLNDSQVMYWEPAKYVARMRALRDGAGPPLLFRCNMGAGHGGASGRYDALRETAFDYAWILNTAGLGAAPPAPSP